VTFEIVNKNKVRAEVGRNLADFFERQAASGLYQSWTGTEMLMYVVSTLRDGANAVDPKRNIILPGEMVSVKVEPA
jgi:hypothetical protein